MTILGIIALIALVVLGLMVLRVKSDPMENELVRKALRDSGRTTVESPNSSPSPNSTPPRPKTQDPRPKT
jgi:hypothetical protein